MILRRAELKDLPAILRIYNDAILKTTATLDTEPKTLEERKLWLTQRKPIHPVVVLEPAEAKSDGSSVVGWASLSPWAERAGYRITAEPSLYLDESVRGKGLGKVLMQWVVDEADRHGFRSLISRIDASNAVSIHLHEKQGFQKIGNLKESAWKFDRLVDVDLLQRMSPAFNIDRFR